MTSLSIILKSLEDTHTLGVQIGQALEPGTVLLFSGELGAGKTTVIKNICEGLGVNPAIVISPTYAIVNRYQGKWMIHHVDLYRLHSAQELEHFDDEDLICSDGMTFVEWPDLLWPLIQGLPQIAFHLTRQDDQSRSLTIQTGHAPYESWIATLKEPQ